MIVAFDGICLGDGPITGVGRCFVDGLTAYARAGHAACVLLVPDGAEAPVIAGVQMVRAPRGALRRQLQLPALLRRVRADVLHSSVAAIPARAPCRTFATVHDLPWLHPEVGEARRPLHTRLLARLVARATSIVVPSQLTASDTAAWLGQNAPPIVVVPHGTNLGPTPTATSTAARTGPLLVLGDDRPRKNRARLREAHALARQRCPSLPELRFVGPPADWVDQPTKHELLQSCRALVHCSLFEGFGLPVLEGLAHGAPVLCSTLPPHFEITQGHAVFVDPRDVDQIAQGMITIHADEALRGRLAHDGHARAAELSCEAVAAAWHRLHHGAPA